MLDVELKMKSMISQEKMNSLKHWLRYPKSFQTTQFSVLNQNRIVEGSSLL